ncbi:hypothetical protein TRICI_004513 [Trichomonascus ciferrii]|uniref:Mannosyl-oligosaccharide glucosidase n=1 Tax=Trichomonascus ciferrii TaxID=44093 RepID=A0A642V740_9ASCO|nr:hypothetical protein TRICI_004513 [Trichomonascus ciferrii]
MQRLWRGIILLCLFIGFVLSKSNDAAILNEYTRMSNASLLWGPYRSNLYFGVRPRGIPHSLMTGLMWYNGDQVEGIHKLRHSCEQGDVMDGYGWLSYDPRLGGTEVMRDVDNHVDITTDFVKTADDGKNWAVRVKGKPRKGFEGAKTVMIFYAGLEGKGKLDLENEVTVSGIADDVITLKGSSPELGKFSIKVSEEGKDNKKPKSGHSVEKIRPATNSHYTSLTVPDENVWRARDIFLTFAQDSVAALAEDFKDDNAPPAWLLYTLPNSEAQTKGRLHYVQKIFEGEFELDVLYSGTRDDELTSQSVTDMIDETSDVVDKKFKQAFDFKAPFNTEEFTAFGKEMFSNLAGGLSYFYGNQKVDRAAVDMDDDEDEDSSVDKVSNVVEEGPHELLTLVPSRSFFPRGFYWDEGFELIPLLEYDADLALEIMASWFSQVDDDGWIAREQILGLESRSKVPEQFQTQYPNVANPPTLMLLLSRIVNKHRHFDESKNPNFFTVDSYNEGMSLGNAYISNPQLLKDYVAKVYPNLQTHYDWFRRSQKGAISEFDREPFSRSEAYRWRGRTKDHCLPSGLDDYPRALVPNSGELHVDLISWVGMMARAMKDFATVLGEEEDAAEYARVENAVIRNIEDLHWSEEDQCYCDVTVDDYDEDVKVCHKGYVSLMPFLLKLVPPENAVDRILPLVKLIRDPEELWTSFGIRSLSASDEFYGKGENYWRGPIWININYMILDALQYYVEESSDKAFKKEASAVYQELRQNLVSTIHNSWKSSKFAWEQYHPDTGKGQGVKHFLGWTSLVVNIMGMPESL